MISAKTVRFFFVLQMDHSSSNNQSMSRYAHRSIKDAFSKAGRSVQMIAAQDAAGLSDRARDSKWYKRWFRSVSKFFGGGHDQQINKTAFGQQNIKTKQSQTKAMKIQKIYGFIRLISELPADAFTTRTNQQQKYIILQDNGAVWSDQGGTRILREFSPFCITISKRYVAITFIKIPETVEFQLVYEVKDDKTISNNDHLPPLSHFNVNNLLITKDNADTVREIYNHINSYVQKIRISTKSLKVKLSS